MAESKQRIKNNIRYRMLVYVLPEQFIYHVVCVVHLHKFIIYTILTKHYGMCCPTIIYSAYINKRYDKRKATGSFVIYYIYTQNSCSLVKMA